MKRLLILTAVSLAASAGCRHCGLCGGGSGATSVYRPPACTPACGSAAQGYPAQGAYAAPGASYGSPDVMAAPALTVPQAGSGPAYPGPEVYTPAN